MEEVINQPVLGTDPVVSKIINRKLLVLVMVMILFFVLLSGLIAFLFYQNQQLKKQISLETIPLPTQTVTPIPTPTPTPDPTAEWSTFININGYSIKVPPEMKTMAGGFSPKEPENEAIIHIEDENTLSNSARDKDTLNIVAWNKMGKNIEDSVKEIYERNISNPNFPAEIIKPIEKTIFAGKEAYTFTVKNKILITPSEEFVTKEGIYREVWLEHNDKFVVISHSDISKINNIVSTFKFLE
ncbi:MAG: hypothetical protein ABID04_02105, partial [Patescibacteria group bacterium]